MDVNSTYIPLGTASYYFKWLSTLRQARRESDRTLPLHDSLSLVRSKTSSMPTGFVIGSPRSGTTLFGRLLADIPFIGYYREPAIGKFLARPVYEGKLSSREATRLYRLRHRLLEIFAKRRGSLIHMEKNPDDSLVSDILAVAFPQAYFFHIVRDPRDVVCSLLRKSWFLASSAEARIFDTHTRYFHGPHPRFFVEPERRMEFASTTDAHRCAWVWRLFFEAASRTQECVPSEQYHEIQYEELVKEPIATTTRAVSLFGRDCVPEAADLMPTANTVNSKSIGQWKHMLTREQIQAVELEVGHHLERFS